MFNSMRRITPAEAAQVIPRRIDVVTAGRGDTVQSLAGRMAYGNAQVERFRVLNGLAANAPGRAGREGTRSSFAAELTPTAQEKGRQVALPPLRMFT